MAVAADQVEIRTEDGSLRLVSLLGEESPKLEGGVGGWESVARPGRRPLTIWRGVSEPLKLTIPMMLDGFASDSSVEGNCRILEKMGGLDRSDPEPPTLAVDGALPHDESRAKSNRWIIDGLEWGDSIRRASDGHRVRQEVTATLMLYVAPDKLSAAMAKKGGGSGRFVRARAGDTYEKIAARALKSGRLGTKLAQFNGKRSADTRIPTGTRVKLPTAVAAKAWKRGR